MALPARLCYTESLPKFPTAAILEDFSRPMSPQVTDPERIHSLLVDRILAGVRSPARYIGGELNAVRKDPAGVDVSFALLFPDVYEVGMSHLGYQILYSILNGLDRVAAERAYALWPDMQRKMRDYGIPLYTLESFQPVRHFDVVGFSLQYEMLYTNVLTMLEAAGIPVLSADRSQDDPIVIAGGPGACAPEPMADFIDLFLPGDGEEIVVEFAELVREAKRSGRSREDTILQAALELEGVYAPAYYEPSYSEGGSLEAVRPGRVGLPERISARKVPDLEAAHFPTDLIVPFIETVHDRVSLEIMRGCTRGCRFCQAGMLRRPVRPRSPERLRELAKKATESTGHDEVALASLSSSDYPEFGKLLEKVGEYTEPRQINISLSSLRVNDQLSGVPEVLQRVRKSTLTIAPEAATERLRNVINKDVTEQELIDGAREAFRQGWRHIKLYFMIGLPTETQEDLDAVVELSERVSRLRGEVAGGAGRVNVSIASFVPKPHTPFQWAPMASRDYLHHARERILGRARMKSVRYRFHEPERSVLEAALARGDRRLGRVLLRVQRDGAQFDAWDEHFSFEKWRQAFDEEGLSLDFYAHRARDTDEALPWDHVDFGLDREFLLEERQKAFRGELTPDCRIAGCLQCGVRAAMPAEARRS